MKYPIYALIISAPVLAQQVTLNLDPIINQNIFCFMKFAQDKPQIAEIINRKLTFSTWLFFRKKYKHNPALHHSIKKTHRWCKRAAKNYINILEKQLQDKQ